MMISPETFYELHLKGKNVEETHVTFLVCFN